MTPLAERLEALAVEVRRGELPQPAQEALGRALRRAERDRWIQTAADLAGGCAALLELARRDGWRLAVWRQRGRCPDLAHPALAALYQAGELPTERHMRRILGPAMSSTGWDDGPDFDTSE